MRRAACTHAGSARGCPPAAAVPPTHARTCVGVCCWPPLAVRARSSHGLRACCRANQKTCAGLVGQGNLRAVHGRCWMCTGPRWCAVWLCPAALPGQAPRHSSAFMCCCCSSSPRAAALLVYL
jgi:hypothetical protein